jgi:hypothetical protein
VKQWPCSDRTNVLPTPKKTFHIKLTGFSSYHSSRHVRESIVNRFALNCSHNTDVTGSPPYCKLFFDSQTVRDQAASTLSSIQNQVLSASRLFVKCCSDL